MSQHNVLYSSLNKLRKHWFDDLIIAEILK
jgi:hypothetical protein